MLARELPVVAGQVAHGGLVGHGVLATGEEDGPCARAAGQTCEQDVLGAALLHREGPVSDGEGDGGGPPARSRLAGLDPYPGQERPQVCGRALVGERTAEAELGALAEPLLDRVMGHDLGVGAAVLDEGGEFEHPEDVPPGHAPVLTAGLPVHHEQALGVRGEAEEALLAPESALPHVGAGEPADRRGDAGSDQAQHDVAYVVVHVVNLSAPGNPVRARDAADGGGPAKLGFRHAG